MKKTSTAAQIVPFETAASFEDYLTFLLRSGARKLLQAAIEEEVESYFRSHLNKIKGTIMGIDLETRTPLAMAFNLSMR